jgi:hypothetical protein
MSAPFRELFVQVPDVLLEILRAAVTANLSPVPRLGRPSAASRIIEAMLGPVATALCDRYGFEQLEVQRSARNRVLEIVGVRPCRYREHEVEVMITDEAIEDARDPASMVLVVLDRASRRPCFCVAPPRPFWFDDGSAAPLRGGR